MNDSEFKCLAHQLGDLKVKSRGSEVTRGYKPDLTLIDETGRLMFIVECEQKTDRKAFLGAVVKAEKYAEDSHCSPTLIIVMKEASNIKNIISFIIKSFF